jgi:cation diffusion facilitator family transporter
VTIHRLITLTTNTAARRMIDRSCWTSGLLTAAPYCGAYIASVADRDAEPTPVAAANAPPSTVGARRSGPTAALERRVLVVSIAATTTLSAIGVVWGIASGSQMILFDGVFGLIGIIVSFVLLRASILTSRGPTPDYPYGRETTTPLGIGFQGFVLLATLVYASFEAVATIRAGGSDFEAGWALVYALLATAGSLVVWWWMRRFVAESDLVHAETTAWRVAWLRGVGMMVGFGAMLAFTEVWESAVPYVDPVMVLLSCALLVGSPLRMIRATVWELTEAAPSDDIQRAVHEAVGSVSAEFAVHDIEVRMTKVGPKLYVEIDADVDPRVTVAQEDDLRRRLDERLAQLPYEVWLNLELHARAGHGDGSTSSARLGR